MASKKAVRLQLSVRLTKTHAVWMEEWARKTGQPAALVIRAALEVLIKAIEGMDFADQVRLIADLGALEADSWSNVAAELEAALRSARERRGNEPGQQSA